jgi:hypothetical protein
VECVPHPTANFLTYGLQNFATQERTFGIGVPYSLIKLTVLNNYCIQLVGQSLKKNTVPTLECTVPGTSFVLAVYTLSSKKGTVSGKLPIYRVLAWNKHINRQKKLVLY